MDESKQISEENKQFLTRLYSSEKKFIDQYQKFYNGKSKAQQLYLEILAELQTAIAVSSIDKFKNLSNFICYIGNVENAATLQTFCNSTENPFRSTNLVIEACKHNTAAILQYIFDNIDVLNSLTINIRGDTIAPRDEDETCHNAFYYAIRSGNLELLSTLINKLPNNFAAQNTELDEILSRAYEELKIKNVPLSNEIEIFVENELINLRFFSTGQVKKREIASLANIKKRIDLVLENISLLHTTNAEEVGERFLFIAKFVAQNIHILKRLLKSTYNSLPWEEIEFCLIVFVNSKIVRQEINLIYNSVLTKERILQHLQHFATKLKNTEIREEDINSKLPKSKRENVITSIIDDYPALEELYNDFEQVKDIYSLEKMTHYIELASTANAKEEEGQFVISRALQITGEHLKNTLESPNISDNINNVLLSTVFHQSSDEVVQSFRDVLSHFHSLKSRIKFEERKCSSYFSMAQNDLNKIKVEITFLLENSKAKVIRMFLKQITDTNDLNAARKLADTLISIIPDLKNKRFDPINTKEFQKLEDLIDKLDKQIDNKTPFETKLFSEIITKIHVEKNKINDAQATYSKQVFSMANIADYVHLISKGKGSKSIKNAKLLLIEESKSDEPFIGIPQLISKIWKSVTARKYSSGKIYEMNSLISDINLTLQLNMCEIKGIEKLKHVFTSGRDENSTSIETEDTIKDINAKDALYKRLGTLKKLLNANGMVNNLNLIETFPHYKNNRQFQLMIETIVLDVMEILQHLRCLGNNFLFVDTYFPMLIGRSLRNHLAHGNALVNVMRFDAEITVLSNAIKLIQEEGNLTTKQIGNSVLDNVTQLNKRHNDNLTLLDNQRAMFEAARQGDIENLNGYVRKGADIKARDINQWNVFHFAAAGGSLEVIKFFLHDKSLDINARDNKRQTPLHIAVSYGRENIVDFFLTEKLFSVYTTGDNETTALHMAAENGHTEVVKILLKHKANAEARDSNKLTPLYVAARSGHQDVVQLLIFNKRITENYFSGSFFTPLHIASLNGHLEVVNVLLTKNANVNARTANGATPLSCAAQQGHNDVVKMLLAAKADVNNQTVDGFTPLLIAVSRGNFEVVNTLLARKSKFDTIYDGVALHEAAHRGYCDIVNILIKDGYKVDSMSEDHVTALQLAAKFGHLDVVQLLIDNKAQISKANIHGYTALHNAAEGGYNDIVKYLLKKGANVNAKTTVSDATPLHCAALCGHVEVAKTLIQNRANINAKNADGSTPLCIAAEHDSNDVVKALLSKGAHIDSPDNNKWTPLHYAVYDNRLDVVNTLVSFGANAKAKTYENNTCIHLAAQCGFLEIVKVLLKVTDVNIKSESGTPLHGAVIGGHLQIVQYLLKNEANVNATDKDDWTPLRLAVQKGFTKIIKVLLANGANINAIDNVKWTPLILAIAKANVEVVELLLAEGANFNCVDKHNNTPLHFAAESSNPDLVEICLKHGALVHAKNKMGLTPICSAVKEGHIKVVSILLEHGAKINLLNNKNSLLHLAVGNGYSEITEMLLANDKSIINFTNQDNITALHVAVISDNIKILNILLKNGANLNIRDNSNRTALFTAVQYCRTHMIEAFLAAGGNVNDTVVTKEGSTLISLTLLHGAVGTGNKDIVEILLKHRVSLDKQASEDVTALFLAAQEGHEDIVKMLLKAGANVNIADDKCMTPLHAAAKKGYDGIVRLLLKYKPKVNARAKNNETALHIASFCGHTNIIEMLLNAGSKINDFDNSGFTPLHYAVESGRERITEILLCKGANVNFPDKYSQTPLHLSANGGYERITELLLRNKADVNAIETKCNMTPLHYASVKGHLQVILVLLKDVNININAIDEMNRTPLHIAVFAGHKRVTKALLNKGAYFDLKSSNGLTPSAVALERGHSEIAKRLKVIEKLFISISENNYSMVEKCISEKVLVNCKSVRWETPLFSASQRGYTGIVRLLLENDAKVGTDNKNDNNMTPLHVAANIETVKLLLKYGAIYNLQNSEGNTPLNLTKDQNIISLLRLTEELFEGAEHGNDQVISKLKSAKPDELEALTNARNKECKTLLLVAITNEHKHISREIADLIQNSKGMQSSKHESNSKLLKAIESNNRQEVENCLKEGKGYINCKDTHGRTPLHYVVNNGNVDILKTLLVAGADATQMTNKGNTLLHTAASKNFGEIVEVVLRHVESDNKLDFINAQTKIGGTTSLHVAAKNGVLAIVRSLLIHGAAYNIKNSEGKTPLNLSEDKNIINLLRLTEELFEGAKRGKRIVVSKLKSAKTEDREVVTKARNNEGKTLLSVAITNEHKELAHEITNLIPNPNEMQSSTKQESDSYRKLLKAIESNNRQEVENCLKEGKGYINCKDTHGRTPLHYVVNNGNVDILKTLLVAGADATQMTNKGNTLLHTAASKNFGEIVEVVLRHVESDNKLDFINAQTKIGGTTSLHVAAKNGVLAIVRSLLIHGAAYDIKNSEGKTPLNLSEDKNIINLLRLTEELFEGAKRGKRIVVSKLKSANTEDREVVTKARNNEGKTLLSVAITNQHKELALKIADSLQNPNEMQSSSRQKCTLNQLKELKDAAKLYLERSNYHLCMIQGMCLMFDHEAPNPYPEKTLREGSHLLVHVYNLVKTYKKCIPGRVLADKNIQVINSKLTELQFHPEDILSGEAYNSTMSMFYFASKGQGTLYYKMLHSNSMKDISLFVEMVERYFNAPTRLFLESVEQNL